ncbi:S26 family signal peptidase [uncultured Ruminococcus sp.]|uniref:S26 family signal peptidase n=1 Tax=uncultured Ruminococcus sp. TaxID=165186 RepID=UPI002931CB73|nr:S26 family signal peptidase [uncultured Ruminococcus sp.]
MKENETKTQNNNNETQSKGKSVFRTILNTIINILIVLVLIVSVVIATLALTSKSTGISTMFGYTIQPIQSDSMKGGSPDGYPSGDFGKGDLMIAKATDFNSSAEYENGDIVTFVTGDENGNKMLIVHRIINTITLKDGTKRYQTQGDNRETSPAPDQEEESLYLPAMEIGSVYYSPGYEGKILKGWGSVLDFIQSQKGFFLVVLLPMIIFFMYAVIRVVISSMNYKKAKADEDKEEAVKAAVAAALASKDEDTEPVKTDGGTAPVEPANAEAEAKPQDQPAEQDVKMTAEELEQFKKFQEFQKMQQASEQAEQKNAKTEE